MTRPNFAKWIGETAIDDQHPIARGPMTAEDELRAAYQAVLLVPPQAKPRQRVFAPSLPVEPASAGLPKPAPARGAADAIAAFEAEEDEDALFRFPGGALLRHSSQESLLTRLLSRPRLVVGSAISLCLLASATYAALGYWWLMGDPLSGGAVAMAGVEENDTRTFLRNIEELEQQIRKESGEAPEPASEEKLLAANPKDEKFNLLSDAALEADKETIGRADPFSPLVRENGPLPMAAEIDPEKRDALENVRFTGFIGDVNAKDKVAVIKVGDAVQGEKTYIRKTGDKFMAEGEPVTIRSISSQSIQLRVGGKNRTLYLQPYQELQVSSTPSAGGSGGATVTAPASGAPAASSAAGATNPALQEPN